MKILLVNPPVREWSKPNVFPLGLGYIASVLMQAGHQVQVLDINGLRLDKKEVELKIKEINFDAVGIGGIITTYKYIKWLVSVLRKYHPHKKIIIGGSVGSSIPKIMFEHNDIDFICLGEGEETVKDLIRALEDNTDLSKVKGIWYRDKNGTLHQNPSRKPVPDLNVIPFPSWDIFPMDIYLKNPIGALNRNKWIDGSNDTDLPFSINLSATRGCPYQCIYCYHDFMGQGHRSRSPANIIDEIETLHKKYDARYFHFVDDEFVINREFVFNFCRLMKELRQKLGKELTWGCAGRVNLMNEEIMAAMADSGCILIGYGIESASQKMLDLIKKRVTVEQAKVAIRLTRKYLGWADCSFMIGYPGENRQTIQETIDFCKELDLVPEVIFFLTPYPGTELYRMALAQGKIRDEEEYVLGLGEQGEGIRVNFTDFSDRELAGIQLDMINELKAWNRVRHN